MPGGDRSPARALGALACALCATCAAGILAAGDAAAQNQPRLLGVGDLPGGAFDSLASGVSADGSTVVGGGESAAGPEAFRWTEAGGIVGLGDLPGGTFLSFADAVSADGSVVAGTGVDSSDESRGFRWTQATGLVALGQFSCSLCPAHAFGMGLSGDGLVVVGEGARRSLLGSLRIEAARWTGGGTSISGLGHLPGPGEVSGANGASGDGAVIVGESDSSAGTRAFVWTPGGGIQALPDVPGALVGSGASAVSADGTTVVGSATVSPSQATEKQAVRWRGPGWGTLELLGTLPGGLTSRAFAVSGDGDIVVGTARDANGDDQAFLWDAANGMRALAQVLADDYGVDVDAWQLREARGVSDVNAAGEVVVVGAGVNPAGDPEGFVAVLSPPACSDGADQDGDGLVDFPADPGCTAVFDRSETPDCADGLDQDGDGFADFPQDPECTSAADPSETPDCADGLENDGDGLADFPADPGCRTPGGLLEDPACDDGADQDGDGLVDFPADPGCLAADDASEGADCQDGLDNDGDGLLDFPADPDCEAADDPAEDPQCSDRVDNDLDGRADYPDAYPACADPADPVESPACADGADNDGDGQVDFPADAGCFALDAPSEAPVSLALGDLLVAARDGRQLFRLDPATGAQTLVSSGALLGAPQGVALRSDGVIVVADPGGLLEVIAAGGQQNRFGAPHAANESLQVAIDDDGAALLLHADGVLRTAFSRLGPGAETPVFALPLPASALLFFHPDALAREADGSLLVSGFGAAGDGIHRYDPDTGTLVTVTPGFGGDEWTDLALEADGTILAAGTATAGGPGLYRVTPSGPQMGAVAALSNGAPWTAPSAVAVAPDGRLFVADAGDCTAGSCTGSEIVEVDAASGARLQVWSGGAIAGPMDLAVVTALPDCANAADDDGDGLVDLADPHCANPWDQNERAPRRCGLGAELAAAAALLLALRAGGGRRRG